MLKTIAAGVPPVLKSVFVIAPLAVAKFVLWIHIWLPGFLVASPTMGRFVSDEVDKKKEQRNDFKIASGFFSGLLFFGLITILVEWQLVRWKIIEFPSEVIYGSAVLLFTNIISLFYEIGRLKLGNQENQERVEDDDEDDDPVDNFMRLLNQIEAIIDSDFFEETVKALLEEIEKLFKEDGLTFEQACHLKKLIDNARANRAGLAKV